jgi:hypothetical protein
LCIPRELTGHCIVYGIEHKDINMMTYDEVLGSYAELARLRDLVISQGKSPRTYADYKAAIFGYWILKEEIDVPIDFRTLDSQFEKHSRLVVWKMFGQELTNTEIIFNNLAELDLYEAERQSQKDLLFPLIVDNGFVGFIFYGDHQSGKSELAVMPIAIWNSIPKADRIRLRNNHKHLPWERILRI